MRDGQVKLERSGQDLSNDPFGVIWLPGQSVYTTEGSWYESTPTRVRWEHEPGATASVLWRPTDLPYRFSVSIRLSEESDQKSGLSEKNPKK